MADTLSANQNSPVAEFELAFVIGAPQLVGSRSHRQLGARGAMARTADRLDQAAGSFGRRTDHLGRFGGWVVGKAIT